MESYQLQAAGLRLRLELTSKKWWKYCQERYAAFSDHSAASPHLTVRISVLPSKKIEDTAVRYLSPKYSQLYFPDSLESFEWFNFVIKSMFAGILLLHDGCLIHGSSVARQHRACVFVGESGAGKSTISQLLNNRILADDRSLLRFIDGMCYVFSSPFYEAHPFPKRPGKFPLSALYFLERREVEEIELTPLDSHESMQRIIPHLVMREELPPEKHRRQLKKVLSFSQKLATQVMSCSLSYTLNQVADGEKLYERLWSI